MGQRSGDPLVGSAAAVLEDTSLDDATAIGASKTDPESFALIFDRHALYVHGYLARRLGPQVADDILADTFLAAFQARGRYDVTRSDARPWLIGIATRLVSSHRRSELRRYRLLQAAASDSTEPSGSDDRVEALVTAEALRAPLAGALAGLSVGD